MGGRISLRVRYTIVTLVTFLAIGTMAFFYLESSLKKFIVSSDLNNITTKVQSEAAKTLDLAHSTSLKADPGYPNFVKNLIENENLTEIRLADPNGQLVYSFRTNDIGMSVLEFANTKAALNGQSAISKIDYQNPSGEITIPIKNNQNDIKGLLIASGPLSTELKNVNATVTEMAITGGAVTFVLIIVIFFVFSNAENTLSTKEHSFIDKSKALEEEQQLDEAIMASVTESLVVINSHGQIMLFNKEAEKITGLKSSVVEYRLYRKIIPLVDKDGKEISPNPITKALNNGQIIKKSIADGIFLKNAKKELVPISLGLAPIFEKDNSIRGVVATISDISTEKELDKVKDEFVYVVAHELGNPIFALDGFLSILETELKKSPKNVQEIIHSARGVNSQLSTLVNDLLEAVRNENGQLVFETEPIDVTEIVSEVVASASFKAKDKKITISYGASKQPRLLGNTAKIKEVITNFVDNAIKYTPEGGHIDIWHDRDDNMIATHVKDNGYGMSSEEQKKLFEKFYRIKNKNTSGISGTGLGLFICRQIVEKCGGKVWAESEEGKGSTFSFELKISKKK